MGLDISVRKLVRPKDVDVKEDGFYTFDEEDIQKLTDAGLEEFISEKENEYYDFVKFFNNNENYTDEWEWYMTSFREGKCVHGYTWKKHPLYLLYKKSHDCLNTPTDLVVTDEEKQLLIEYKYATSVDTLQILNKNQQGEDSIGELFSFLHDIVRKEFLDEEIPTYKQIDKGIYTQGEYGYQRKGLNGVFYDTFKKSDYFVYKLSDLEAIRDNCTNDKEGADDFQRNIIDCFTEGEDVVTFDW